MPTVVIDTGVLLVAEKLHDEAGVTCVSRCVEQLRKVSAGSAGVRLVLDSAGAILSEYMGSKLAKRDPRGPGALFLLWLLTHRNNPAACEVITLNIDAQGEYEAFPKDAALKKFDRSDRKFVAASLAHVDRPPIAVALDRGWRVYNDTLRCFGVTVEMLCPEDAARLAARRSRQ